MICTALTPTACREYLIALLLVACQELHADVTMTRQLTLTSSAFSSGDNIPTRYTCEGENTSPPLEWSGVPSEAKSLALLVDDPNAPDLAKPKRTWVMGRQIDHFFISS